MGALVAHLEGMLRRGCDERELVQAVADELSGGDLLDDELADYAAIHTDAAARERELHGHISRAAESSALDREALRLTLLYAHRGGLYLPEESAQARDPLWGAQEALRFTCFSLIVRLLIDRLGAGSMPSTDYPSAVTELATRLARMPVHAPRR